MKKLSTLAAALFLGFSLGCGGPEIDTSKSVPPPTDEDISQDIEKAMEAGEISPKDYGKEQGSP